MASAHAVAEAAEDGASWVSEPSRSVTASSHVRPGLRRSTTDRLDTHLIDRCSHGWSRRAARRGTSPGVCRRCPAHHGGRRTAPCRPVCRGRLERRACGRRIRHLTSARRVVTSSCFFSGPHVRGDVAGSARRLRECRTTS